MPCRICGRQVLPPRRRYCSPACAARQRNRPNPKRDPNLNSRARRLAAAHVRATQPNCMLCGYPIDLALPRHPKPHPLSSVVDELLPRALGGSAIDPANLGHAHRLDNGIKGSTWPITAELQARCRAKVEQVMQAERQPIRRW
jgi:hypothetical protein